MKENGLIQNALASLVWMLLSDILFLVYKMFVFLL